MRGYCIENIIHFFFSVCTVFLKSLNWHSACILNALGQVCLKGFTLAWLLSQALLHDRHACTRTFDSACPVQS